MRGWKNIFHADGNEKKAKAAIPISDKIDFKTKTVVRDLWDNIKPNNIRIIGVPEGEEREKGPEKIFEEIIVGNFPNMGKEITTQVQEAQRVPYRINPRRNTPRHILINQSDQKIKTKRKY